MKAKWSHLTAGIILTSSLLFTSAPVFATGASAQAAQTSSAQSSQADQTAHTQATESASYQLNDKMSVKVEGVYNEADSQSLKLGAILRVTNNSDQTLRIPDHEVRLTTEGGITYTLSANSGNVHGIPAKSQTVLNYYKQIEHPGAVQLKTLSIVHVDYDVYPKKETTLVKAPVGDLTWNGPLSKLSGKANLEWGTPFAIPELVSPLTYTPVYYSKNYTAQGVAYMVQLLADNPTNENQTVPAFGLDGVSDAQSYSGSRVEQQPIVLQPGEKKSIHYVINTDMNADLKSLNVLLSGSFVQATPSGKPVMSSFGIGKLNIALPEESMIHTGVAYKYGSPIDFSSWNHVINPDLKVSLVELHASPNAEDGTRTVFAKFKLNNTGDRPQPVPNFQTELWSKNGYAYSGTRQQLAPNQIQAGTSYVVSYAFTMPSTETDNQYYMELLGDKTSSPYKSRIAALGVQLQRQDDKNDISLYPFTLNIKDLFVVPKVTPTPTNAFSYSYQVKVDLDLKRDAQVVLDNSFSNLKFELYDGNGKLLGSQSYPFTGTNRLTNGYQTLNFNNVITDQSQTNVTLKIYESVTTPTGEANRLLYTFQQ